MTTNRIIAAAVVLGTVITVASGATAADAKKGAKVFNKCKTCHIVEATGPKKVGPPLAGFLGRKAGSLDGYKFSSDLKAAGDKGLVWTDATFLSYMEDTKSFVGGFIGKKKANTKMAFAGLKKSSDRDDLLAYLKDVTK